MIQAFIRLTFFSFLLWFPSLVFAQGGNSLVSDELLETFSRTRRADFDAVSELYDLLQSPDIDPIAITDDMKARLQPITPKSELAYNMAYLTMIRYLNTLGQAYFKLGIADSAAHYFRGSKQLAAENKSAQWVAINAGFEGQLYLVKGEHQKALTLFEQGYLANWEKDLPMESFSLTGMGQSLFAMGQAEKAKPLLWQALYAALQAHNTVSSAGRWCATEKML